MIILRQTIVLAVRQAAHPSFPDARRVQTAPPTVPVLGASRVDPREAASVIEGTEGATVGLTPGLVAVHTGATVTTTLETDALVAVPNGRDAVGLGRPDGLQVAAVALLPVAKTLTLGLPTNEEAAPNPSRPALEGLGVGRLLEKVVVALPDAATRTTGPRAGLGARPVPVPVARRHAREVPAVRRGLASLVPIDERVAAVPVLATGADAKVHPARPRPRATQGPYASPALVLVEGDLVLAVLVRGRATFPGPLRPVPTETPVDVVALALRVEMTRETVASPLGHGHVAPSDVVAGRRRPRPATRHDAGALATVLALLLPHVDGLGGRVALQVDADVRLNVGVVAALPAAPRREEVGLLANIAPLRAPATRATGLGDAQVATTVVGGGRVGEVRATRGRIAMAMESLRPVGEAALVVPYSPCARPVQVGPRLGGPRPSNTGDGLPVTTVAVPEALERARLRPTRRPVAPRRPSVPSARPEVDGLLGHVGTATQATTGHAPAGPTRLAPVPVPRHATVAASGVLGRVHATAGDS